MIASLDLFSGYGGISYGLKDYVKPIGYCEIDRYARAILASRISDGELCFAPILGDVKSLRGQIGAADIITGGFPCQDISSAGLGAGLAGERSGLFFEIVRLTKEIAPTFVFLENVPAIRTRGLRQVIGAFTEIGYDCRWTCLSASSLGAPHKRERWFLLARNNMLRRQDKRGNFQKASSEKSESGDEHGSIFENVSNTESTRLEGHGLCGGDAARFASLGRNSSSREPWWEIEPNVGRVVNGTPFRVDRIKAIGNGVVPLQVKTAFEKLIGIQSPPQKEETK